MKTESATKANPLSGNIRTMPATFYRSEKQYELSLDRIFARCWQFLGDEASILHDLESEKTGDKAPGATKKSRPLEMDNCVLPISLMPGSLNEPLILVRQKEELRCLSNVCTHRGAILVNEAFSPPESVHTIRCCYHGRRFNLDGHCLTAPGFEDAQDFPARQDHLPKAAMANLGNFMFAALDPAFTLDELLGDMKERLAFLPLEEFKFAPQLSRDYFIDANWALYVDNYLEGLHVPFVHPSLGVLLDTKTYRTEIQKLGNLQVGVASNPKDSFELPPQSPDFDQNIAAYYYWLFPNMMFNFYPWGLSVNIVLPLAHNRTRVRFLTYVWKEDKFGNYAPEDINQTEMEDEAVVHLVQKGIQSRLYNSGRYSPTWEQGVHQFHKLLQTFLARA